MQVVAVFFLASIAIGGVAYVFIYPLLSGERKAEQQMVRIHGFQNPKGPFGIGTSRKWTNTT